MLVLLAALLAVPPGDIAFVGAAPGAPLRVHIIATNGGVPRAIGPDHADGLPAWSPDGSRLAFAVQADGASRIYVCDADGSGGRFLDHAQRVNRGPVWSPDGVRLAYTAGEGLDAQVIVAAPETGIELPWGGGRTSLMNPIWAEHHLLDRLFERFGDGGRPSFVPHVIAEPHQPSILIAIGLVGAPGSLTTDMFIVSESEALPFLEEMLPSAGVYEEYAPAAARDVLAFESNDGGDREIFVITRRNSWDLSNHAAAEWRPVWSPDGRWLAFESFRSGTRGIYRCHQRTSRVLRVVADQAADCWGPAWSPDSEWLAYTTDRDGAPAVWTVRADGATGARLTPESLNAGLAAWRPAR